MWFLFAYVKAAHDIPNSSESSHIISCKETNSIKVDYKHKHSGLLFFVSVIAIIETESRGLV